MSQSIPTVAHLRDIMGKCENVEEFARHVLDIMGGSSARQDPRMVTILANAMLAHVRPKNEQEFARLLTAATQTSGIGIAGDIYLTRHLINHDTGHYNVFGTDNELTWDPGPLKKVSPAGRTGYRGPFKGELGDIMHDLPRGSSRDVAEARTVPGRKQSVDHGPGHFLNQPGTEICGRCHKPFSEHGATTESCP